MKTFFGGHGPKWAWQSVRGTLKLTFSKMSRWNKPIFCMMVQIQERELLAQWLLGGLGRKWPWSFSS